ncbi:MULTISPECIES: methyltransferase, TIGR04325 family [unclassified Synechococcus]|uniref:methyltransferase, TIGR04325 family n=1 Tax=unclassified Synechococcus TaxID=2626047 RepID=UPI0012EAE30A|nr:MULTISPECIES: methyltransferase, TIGR04325 family [unclassified Synechococcus]WFN58684.1 methyltransferase, TIGR04325 family [Synechococcus sp. CCFWC 502]
MPKTKALLKSLIPPALWKIGHQIKRSRSLHNANNNDTRTVAFEGPFSSWKEAAACAGDGWDSQEITQKTLGSALQVRDGRGAFEQDGLLREKIIYSETILAFLILTLSHQKATLDIIDFGGGFGVTYFQNRKLLRELGNIPIRWNIVERPIFQRLGETHFQTSEVLFFSSIEDALKNITKTVPIAALFSGSLQYIDDPFALLRRLFVSQPLIIAFDRILTKPIGQHDAFVQHPDPEVYYRACYPVWRFSKEELGRYMVENGFELIEDFASSPEKEFDHCGLIYIKRR